MPERLKNDQIIQTSGSSFFMVSNIKSKTGAVSLIDVGSFGLVKNTYETIFEFLQANNTTAKEIDIVLYAFSDESKLNELQNIFAPGKIVDYQKLSGTYYTNAAFAMHYAIDILSHQPHPIFADVKNVLVYKKIIPENLGLILLGTKNE